MRQSPILTGILYSFLATLSSSSVIAADSHEPRYSYLYRDKQVSLTLDTRRVMFVRKSDVSELIPSERAMNEWKESKRSVPAIPESVCERAVRVVPDDSVRMWSLEVAEGSRTSEQIESLVSSLVSEEQVRYAGPAFVDPEGRPLMLSGYYLVSFVDGTSEEAAREIIEMIDGGTLLDYHWASTPCLARVEPVRPNGFEILEAVTRGAQRPEVRYAEPGLVMIGRNQVIPNDPGFGLQWGLRNTGQSGGFNDIDIDAPEAWDDSLGQGITILVLDSGVQRDHPDLNYDLRFGKNFRTLPPTGDGGPLIAGGDKHGTSVAGVISARFNNAVGVAGTAPASFIVSARIGDEPAGGNVLLLTNDGVAAAVRYASEVGARVTNSSFSLGVPSNVVEFAYIDMFAQGIVNFAASGNSHPAPVVFPASSPAVVAVGSIDRRGLLSPSSCRGPELQFVAPGVDIYTTDRTGCEGYTCFGGDNDYTIQADASGIDGTSFASPHAAGVAALILKRNPRLSPDELVLKLRQTAFDVSPSVYGTGYDQSTGWGLINARAALDSTPVARLGDADGDGIVDFGDITSVLANFGRTTSIRGDANLDGFVTFLDITTVLANFDNP